MTRNLIRNLHDKVTRRTVVVGISTVAVAAIRVHIAKSIDDVLAVILQSRRALLAVGLEARRVLRANAHAVADLNALFHLAADAHGLADDFMADADGVGGGALQRRRGSARDFKAWAWKKG